MKVVITAVPPPPDDQERQFTIEESQSKVFGRRGSKKGQQADFVFDDSHMSRLHFRIRNRGDFAEFEDCGATNTTRYNGLECKQGRLQDGDTLTAGKTKFRVQFLPKPMPTFEPPAEVPEHTRPDSESSLAPPPRRPVAESPSAAPRVTNEPIDPFEFESDAGLFPPISDRPSENKLGDTDECIDPFDDSLGSKIDSGINSRVEEVEPIPQPASQVLIVARTTEGEAAEGFSQYLEAISQDWVVRLVLHFLKARTVPPENLLANQLFTLGVDWNPQATGPIMVSWEEVKSQPNLLAMLPRLCRSDACVAYFGDEPTELSEQIRNMLRIQVAGFSLEDGLLPCFWPSSLATLIDSTTPATSELLFGTAISGAYFCVPGNDRRLIALARGELARFFSERDFRETPHIMAP